VLGIIRHEELNKIRRQKTSGHSTAERSLKTVAKKLISNSTLAKSAATQSAVF
jgi:hypothetical protein